MPSSQTGSRIVERALEMIDPAQAVEYIKSACAGSTMDAEGLLMWYKTALRMRDAEESVRIGDTLGNYKILGPLGKGGIARVFLAEHNLSTNYAAIKVFKRSAISVDGEEVWRSDPALLSRFNHDNIVRFHDVGMTEDKTPYVIMEHVDGSHVDNYCNNHRLTVRERLELFRALCAVILYVHGKGIAHLDLKPSNILVSSAPKGKLKLIDFGAGKLLRFVAHEGAPPPSRFTKAFSLNYASPEHLRGEYALVNEVSDIYSLGAVLYKLLTDHTPLNLENEPGDAVPEAVQNRWPLPPSRRLENLTLGEDSKSSPEEAYGQTSALYGAQRTNEINGLKRGAEDTSMGSDRLAKISGERNCRPEQLIALLKGDLDAIVLKCLEKGKAKRYQTVEELDADIARFLGSRPVKARHQSWLYRAGKYTAMLLGVKTGLFGWPKWKVVILRSALLMLVFLGIPFVAWRFIFKSLPQPAREVRLFRAMFVGENGEPFVREKQFDTLVQNVVPGVNLELMSIPTPPAGIFQMGGGEALGESDEDKLQRTQELPVHDAVIQHFYLGRTEVTQAQWRAVASLPSVMVELDPEPSEIKESSAPVTNVSYLDAVEFCVRLSRATGLNYRLPTEAEWEYACRAGSRTVYGSGNALVNEIANFNNMKDKPLSASRKRGNAFGLYNMSGNVWEWTQDMWYPSYEYNKHLRPGPWEAEMQFPDQSGIMINSKDYRVLRGGAFDQPDKWCRCSSRTNGTAHRQDVGRNGQTGFRVALSPTPGAVGGGNAVSRPERHYD